MPIAFLLVIGLILAACGGKPATPAPTLPPPATLTPRFTPLPPVPTEAPYGSADRPYQIVVFPPEGSNTDPSTLEGFLKDRTGLSFKAVTAGSDAELLSDVCGSLPTFAWVDGWTLLAAQAKGCANLTLQIKNGGATGIKSDLIVSTAAAIDTLAAMRASLVRKVYCRLSKDDVASWVLPVIMLREPGGYSNDPFPAFKSVKDYSDSTAIVSDVSNNACISAIPSGTLTSYKIPDVADVTKTVKVVATTPELPFGGLVASITVPNHDVDTVAGVFPDHLDALQGLVVADSLVPATNADIAPTLKAFSDAGINFALLGP